MLIRTQRSTQSRRSPALRTYWPIGEKTMPGKEEVIRRVQRALEYEPLVNLHRRPITSIVRFSRQLDVDQ
jgi:hypothetical protein